MIGGLLEIVLARGPVANDSKRQCRQCYYHHQPTNRESDMEDLHCSGLRRSDERDFGGRRCQPAFMIAGVERPLGLRLSRAGGESDGCVLPGAPHFVPLAEHVDGISSPRPSFASQCRAAFGRIANAGKVDNFDRGVGAGLGDRHPARRSAMESHMCSSGLLVENGTADPAGISHSARALGLAVHCGACCGALDNAP